MKPRTVWSVYYGLTFCGVVFQTKKRADEWIEAQPKCDHRYLHPYKCVLNPPAEARRYEDTGDWA